MANQNPAAAPQNNPTPKQLAAAKAKSEAEAAAKASEQLDKPTSISAAIIASQVRESIQSEEVATSDVAEWPRKPWLAYDYLTSKALEEQQTKSRKGRGRGKHSKKSHVPDITELDDYIAPAGKEPNDSRLEHLRKLLGDDVLKTLAIWSEKAREGEQERKDFENNLDPDYPNIKDKLKDASDKVASIHSDLEQRLTSYEQTEEALNTSKQLNPVEKFFHGAKEYVWDDFKAHPLMSVGLVFLTYLAFRTLQKNNPKIWTLTKYAAAAIIAGAFIKSKFGVEPTEFLAEQAERMGWEGGAKGIREMRDTVGQAFGGPEGKGTANHYYHERLGLGRKKERIVFDAMLTQSPGEFVEWYDEAKKWRQSGNKEAPGSVTGFMEDMCEGDHIPSYFKNLDPAERISLTLNIADTMFKDIAKTNGKTPEAHVGLDIVRGKYVDGTYFDNIWTDWEIDLKLLLKDPDLPDEFRQRINDALPEGKSFCAGMKQQIQKASGSWTLMDVLYTERAWDKIPDYDGAGESIKSLISEGLVGLNNLSGDAYEAAKKALQEVQTYVTTTVPKAAGEVWKDDVEPYLYNDQGTGLLDKGFDKWEELDNWLTVEIPIDAAGNPLYVDADGNGLTRLENTIDKGTGSFWFLVKKGEPLGDLLIQMGHSAGEAVEITLAQLKKLTEWLREQMKMSASLRTVRISKKSIPRPPGPPPPGAPPGPNIDVVDITVGEALKEYKYRKYISLVIRIKANPPVVSLPKPPDPVLVLEEENAADSDTNYALDVFPLFLAKLPNDNHSCWNEIKKEMVRRGIITQAQLFASGAIPNATAGIDQVDWNLVTFDPNLYYQVTGINISTKVETPAGLISVMGAKKTIPKN
ncbi:MAG: hypothetical protein ABIA92_02010 [Patescibacteria group bacterium]